MSKMPDVAKRLLVGRALRSTQVEQQPMRKRVALPVLASDPLSSVAYAPQELLMMLWLTGSVAFVFSFSPWVAAAILLLLLIVVASYRQVVRAYPGGGGDYSVATANLGQGAGMVVASAVLVDYVLIVGVSASAAVENLGAAIPWMAQHKTPVAVAFVVVLALMNLRGIRGSFGVFALPAYAFVGAILVMIAAGAVRIGMGDEPAAPTAGYEVASAEPDMAGFALVFLLLRAFSSGCAALTGVETVSNAVPAFRKPRGRNAATTLFWMGITAVVMFAGVIYLAVQSGVRVSEEPATGILIDGRPAGEEYVQDPLLAQVAEAVFGDGSLGFIVIVVATALILLVAANTAFNGFPQLSARLARDRYLPRQLHTRGDRLTFSNGILMLTVVAALLIVAFEAEVTKLIQLYIVGVFVSFTLSQFGMVRHWTRAMEDDLDSGERFRMARSRLINGIGGTFTGLVLIVVVITKFSHGAWIVCLAIPALFFLMKGIRGHYDAVARELLVPEDESEDERTLPARNHAIVLVSKIHRPTLRALAFARATRPSSLEAVTVAVDPDEANALLAEWERRDIPVPLKILDSPYREITKPVIDYVRAVRRRSPRDVITVYLPEYVVGHWWENLLHNQSAIRLKSRLLFLRGVMVTSVPYQLRSSHRMKESAKS